MYNQKVHLPFSGMVNALDTMFYIRTLLSRYFFLHFLISRKNIVNGHRRPAKAFIPIFESICIPNFRSNGSSLTRYVHVADGVLRPLRA
jgi:hypothetical protein